MSDLIPTPRTDAEAEDCGYEPQAYQAWEFARRLERALKVQSDAVEALRKVVSQLKRERDVLEQGILKIKEATDPDTSSYRSDDREGCLDFVYATSKQLIT